MDKCPSVWLSTSAWETTPNLQPVNNVDINWELTKGGSQGFGRSRGRVSCLCPVWEDAKAQVIMTEGKNHQEACSLTFVAVSTGYGLVLTGSDWHVWPPCSFSGRASLGFLTTWIHEHEHPKGNRKKPYGSLGDSLWNCRAPFPAKSQVHPHLRGGSIKPSSFFFLTQVLKWKKFKVTL